MKWFLLFCFIFALEISLARGDLVNEDADEEYDEKKTDLAILTVGISGSGKSLIDNLVMGENVFQHGFSATSVTRLTESAGLIIDNTKVSVYNMPGLIEGDLSAVPANKREIEKAFSQATAQLIFVVFSLGVGGRVSAECLSNFRAIEKAYEFQRNSIVWIMNGVQSHKVQNRQEYESQVFYALEKGLGWSPSKPIFLDYDDELANPASSKFQSIRKSLISAIMQRKPYAFKHVKNPNVEIEIDADLHKKYQAIVEETKRQLDVQTSQLRTQLAQIQQAMEEERKHSAQREAQLMQQIRASTTGKKKRGLGRVFRKVVDFVLREL